MVPAASRSETTRSTLQRAALRVAIEFGVKGVTHRRVAAEAGVALGSASYHYEHIDELMFEAFASWVRSRVVHYVPLFEVAQTDEDVIAAVNALLHAIHGSTDARILLLEIYAQSVRDAQYHELVACWSRDTRASLLRLYTPQTAQQIEAVWKALAFSCSWAPSAKPPRSNHCSVSSSPRSLPVPPPSPSGGHVRQG